MNSPKPGETWIARDGRVAQVFANTGHRADVFPLSAEYSDGSRDVLTCHGWGSRGNPSDLVSQSPWDAVRADILSKLDSALSALADDIWDDAFWGIYRRIFGRASSLALEADSEALEFIAWAELRGLTPETLVSMRGKVAA